jgi:tetraacyldisaccharide-1-P 4'-kinase
MSEAYNKQLCDERQINRNRELREMKDTDIDHENRITAVENAVLVLTSIAKNDKFNRIVTACLCAVIVALVFGKEIAAAFVMAAIP